MKHLTKIWSMALLLTAAMFMVSCQEDEPTIDVGEGLAVADGFYFAKEGEDPQAEAQLVPSKVDAPDFSAQDRDGFVSSYTYLTAGSYNLVQVEEREVTQTLGGPTETITDELSACDYNSYTLVAAVADGAAFSVASDGLYRLSYDEITGEIVIYEIEVAGAIGSATEGGWGSDTPMEADITPEKATFSVTGIVLRPGEFKFRFNCRWNIDRRVDPSIGFDDPANGCSFFTNFGGSIDDLKPGNEGGNLQIASDEDGVYTLTLTWEAATGWTASKERTGDAPEITFDPNDYQWAFVGNATADNWGEFKDRNMVYKGADGGTHKWVGVATFGADGEFKFRANDAWDINLGGSLPADGSEVVLTLGGSNIANPGAGDYYVVITTADEGASWKATMTDAGWGIIGQGSPQGNWDADLDLTAEGFSGGITTYTITGDFTTEEWKFRAGDDWALNLGGSLDALTVDGGNLSFAEAGNYTVTLTFDGEAYSATAAKN